MENLNGLNFVKKTDIEWDEIDSIIKNTVNCEYISFNEARQEDGLMYVSFRVLDKSKEEEIKDCFKKFIAEEYVEYTGMLDDISYLCNIDNEFDIDVDSDVVLGIIEVYLNNTYNININVRYIKVHYDYIEVAFDVKEENKKLTVQTPKGDIVVKVDGDDSCPGVTITFESEENIKERAMNYESNSIDLVRVEYGIPNKELRAFIWADSNNNDYTDEISFNDSLIFNEDFTILEEGTKIEFKGKIAYITGDDRDNCPDGYEESLNYCIKYALENETYEELCERIKTEDWYDDMIIWHWAKAI